MPVGMGIFSLLKGFPDFIKNYIEIEKATSELILCAMPCGMQIVANATIVNETRALEYAAGCKATVAACGGVGDSQGAVTLTFFADEEKFAAAVQLLESIKGEQALPDSTRDCPCSDPCHHGKA